MHGLGGGSDSFPRGVLWSFCGRVLAVRQLQVEAVGGVDGCALSATNNLNENLAALKLGKRGQRRKGGQRNVAQGMFQVFFFCH